jgi:hypothetical protein
MSVLDVLKVMNAFIRSDRIISRSDARTMVESLYGIDGSFPTNIGTVYWKNGLEHKQVEERQFDYAYAAEQTLALFLPRDFELVVFVNSPVGRKDEPLGQQVADAIKQSIELNLKVLWPW